LSVSDVFCRFERPFTGSAFAGSLSNAGLVSLAEAFRFRAEGGGGGGGGSRDAVTVDDVAGSEAESGDAAACLADALVVLLVDMSISVV